VTTEVAVAACLGLAVALALPAPKRILPRPASRAPTRSTDAGWMRRWRPLWSLLAGLAAATFLAPPLAGPAAVAVATAVWVLIDRTESPAERRARESARHDLPHLVGLLADALRAGQSPTEALELVTRALPGPAADRLAAVVPRLRLGVEPSTVWAGLAADTALGPLGRALARAEATGAPVVSAVGRLADALAEDVRGDVEDRARAVGVKAALPLGLCLLPSFVLLGIVPVVAGMLGTLGL
jgi:Flp pilus assembly protein TadB